MMEPDVTVDNTVDDHGDACLVTAKEGGVRRETGGHTRIVRRLVKTGVRFIQVRHKNHVENVRVVRTPKPDKHVRS